MKRFKRRSASRKLKPRVVVITEGTLTEPVYLDLFFQFHGDKTSTLHCIPLGQDPRNIVERAIWEREKSRRDPDSLRDSYWAMFDKDDHTRFQEAVKLAEDKNIFTAISNPSFELWAILHYELQDAPITQRECEQKLRNRIPGFGKGKRFEDVPAIKCSYRNAVDRARQLLTRRLEERTPFGNPSTTVQELTEFLRLGK